MKNFITKLLSVKYIFDFSLFFKKTNYLVIGNIEDHLIRKIVLDKRKYILDISKQKKINIIFFFNFSTFIIFLRVLFEENFITAYYAFYVKSLKCKNVITFYDNDINFYKLKKYFPYKTFISIQNGSRHILNDIFGLKELKIRKDLKADLIFVFNKQIKKKYESFIDARVIVVGSFKNNMVSKYLKINKTANIAYISQYRDNIIKKNKSFNWKNIKITKKEYYQNEKKLFHSIHFFCKKNRIKLYVICATKELSEKKYFKSLAPNQELNFINKSDNRLLVYKTIHMFKMIVCSWSTLGYESLSRNIKTCFFRQKIYDLPDRSFGWPNQILKEAFFYTENVNEKKIKDILDKIYHMPTSDWLNKITYFQKNVMFFDYQNTIIRKFINNV